jgi:arylsulfatase A-like enzyme
VLLVSLDTVRQDVLGCYGRRPRHAPGRTPTPALDRLAAEGVRMADAYAPSSWTLPSHISLMTGLPPLVHAVETESAILDPGTPTMAEILRNHGYRTVGVYSAPYLDPHWGFGRGFDEYRAVYGPTVVRVSERAEKIRSAVEQAAAAGAWSRYDDLKKEEAALISELNDASQTVETSAEVARAVESEIVALARGAAPWFVFAHFFDAHCDYAPPPPYDTAFDPEYAGAFTHRQRLHGRSGGGLARSQPAGRARAGARRPRPRARGCALRG